ncbi:hypothetical protein H6M51_12530 [Rhizobium sp. AQ_MP]|uniref:hypothetical protein n=1 Tax=Rhizobium sp. AQ_MP TaxID=2761536 RepID=UPI00163B2866|nr:hypothetical protein [Rhizobium sp. AQ_MP]MBC2773692.1 hypothetical protein [Rhizobium sp. AQ_MP]
MNTWRQSTQWRMISREAIKRWNAKRETLPKCGARRKRDGLPCSQLAKENGRCHYHGGTTPKGDQWGLVQWPNGKAPDAEAKLQAKLKRIERIRKAKAKRLAAMSPEERQRYDQRAKTHAPGPAAERARRRDDRKRAAEIRASLETPDEKPVSAELAELQRQAAALEEARDHYRRLAEQEQAKQDRGVFG